MIRAIEIVELCEKNKTNKISQCQHILVLFVVQTLD
jgi:hypothetical protein